MEREGREGENGGGGEGERRESESDGGQTGERERGKDRQIGRETHTHAPRGGGKGGGN